MKNLNIIQEGKEGYGLLIEQDAGYITPNLTQHNTLISENANAIDFNLPDYKELYIDCILQKFDTPNRNKRVYPEAILKKQVEKYGDLVKTNSAVSEADHPATTTISLLNISHLITDMWWGKNSSDKHILYGKLRLILSPGFIKYGIPSMIGDKIYIYLMIYKIRIGISSRGVGSVKMENNLSIVQDDFELVGFDLVTTPSTIGAFLFPDGNVRDITEEKKHIENESKIIKPNTIYNDKFNHIDDYLNKIKNNKLFFNN